MQGGHFGRLTLFIMKATRFFLKATAIIIILAALSYGGFILFRGAEMKVPVMFRPAPGPRLLISMDGFRFTKSENGRESWLMNAGNADLYENKEAQLKDIEILFSNADKKEAVLRGATGIMDTISGNASILRGTREVRIITSDGYLLTTDSLYWKADQRLVWTEDPFKLLGSEIYLEGKGLSANVDMRTIVVKANVKAVLQE
jgi:LPS export ABC transporter protein LptC